MAPGDDLSAWAVIGLFVFALVGYFVAVGIKMHHDDKSPPPGEGRGAGARRERNS